MIDDIQPPTDNLYKFIAIGGLAFALVTLIFLFREQAAQRERWVSAQVELLSADYKKDSGVPTDPALRPAYFRREFAELEASGLIQSVKGGLGQACGISLAISILAFAAWGWRVQRYEDTILRLTSAKLEREEKAATRPPSS